MYTYVDMYHIHVYNIPNISACHWVLTTLPKSLYFCSSSSVSCVTILQHLSTGKHTNTYFNVLDVIIIESIQLARVINIHLPP